MCISAHERQVLEQEAARHALSLEFCANEETFIQWMQRQNSWQHIFDCSAPSGYFYQDEWNKRHHPGRIGEI